MIGRVACVRANDKKAGIEPLETMTDRIRVEACSLIEWLIELPL
jgi:hypothetical protein